MSLLSAGSISMDSTFKEIKVNVVQLSIETVPVFFKSFNEV